MARIDSHILCCLRKDRIMHSKVTMAPLLMACVLLATGRTASAFAPLSTTQLCSRSIMTPRALGMPSSMVTPTAASSSKYHRSTTMLPMAITKITAAELDAAKEADLSDEDITAVLEEEKKRGGIIGFFRGIAKFAATLKYIISKVIAYLTLSYGIALTSYGYFFPTQINVLSVARSGGFNKIERSIKASLKGGFGVSATALIRSPSLVFATIAIANSKKRRKLQEKFLEEHEKALADGEMTDEESQALRKLQKKQIKLENRAIRRIKNGRNFFIRTLQNSNWRELQTIVGDTVLMLTGILAAVQPTIIGDFVLRYYVFLNMGSLLLEANGRAGYPFSSRITEKTYLFDTDRVMVKEVKKRYNFVSPLSKFFVNRIPFLTGEKDAEEVAAEELAFVQNVGKIFTYTISGLLMFNFPKIGLRINAALTSASVLMRGLTTLLNDKDDDEDKVKERMAEPGKLRGGNGGVLTLALTAVALLTSILLENGKMPVPQFWTPMTPVDMYMKKAIAFGTELI